VIQFLQPSFSAKSERKPLVRHPNDASRSREYLTADKVKRMILGSELIALRWDQIALKADALYVSRLKHGSSSTHSLHGPVLRALRAWKRQQPDTALYVFTSLRGGPMFTMKKSRIGWRSDSSAGRAPCPVLSSAPALAILFQNRVKMSSSFSTTPLLLPP